MSQGRVEVNGSFQLSEYREPSAVTANELVASCARVEAVKGRGKGAMTVALHTDDGAQINVVVQLSSDVEKKLILIVAKEQSEGASSVLNQANQSVQGNTTIVSVNIGFNANITKFDADIQGKLESASIGDVLNNFTYSELLAASAEVYPAGFSDNTPGANLNARWSRMRSATDGSEAELAGKVVIAAPGRGHIGSIRSL